MSLNETRRHQMFPGARYGADRDGQALCQRLGAILRARRGRLRRRRATRASMAGAQGHIEVVGRDGLDHEVAITSHGAGQISGELRQLTGRAALARGRAGPEGCTALPFDAAHLRALVVGSAELGETIMRAFILRRVGLIQEGGAGSMLVGRAGAPDLVRLQGFLAATSIPTPSWTLRRTRKAALWSSAWACSPRSCR